MQNLTLQFGYINLNLELQSINSPILEKFTDKEIKKKVGKDEKDIRNKVLLLANGLIDVHGYPREEAFERALLIARKWKESGGTYSK